MADPLQRIVVVLSSPGDLGPEREKAREAVEWLNKHLATRFNMWIDLKCWEDTGPYAGRPQTRLTGWVNECDIFVGMLWEAWGEPTGNGHSSGFEEEFEHADARFKRDGRPEIALYFKNVPSAHARSAGFELSKNLDFRRARAEKKDHRFKEFLNEDEFKGSFLDCLMGYVAKKAVDRPVASSPEEPATRGAGTHEHPPDTEAKVGSSQITKVFRRAMSVLDMSDSEELSFDEKARIYLTTAAWFFGDVSGAAPSILGVHECNILYSRRKCIEPAGAELWFLIRTLVGDQYGTRPGYYWTSSMSVEQTTEILSFLALHDPADEVRSGAVRLLGMLEDDTISDLVARISRDSSSSVRLALLQCLEGRSLSEHAGTATALMSDVEWGVRSEAERVYFVLTALQDPDKAFGEVIERKAATEQLLKALLPYRKRASTNALRAMLESDSRDAQLFALEGLAESGQITEEEARRFARSKDHELAAAGMLALLHLDRTVDEELKALDEQLTENYTRGFGWLSAHRPRPDKRIRIARVHRLSKDKLLDMLHSNLSSSDTTPVYRALAMEHFDDVQDLLREDIKSGFASLRRRRVERVRAELGDAAAVLVETLIPEISDFAQQWFVEAILVGLAKHGGQEDLGVARKVLSDAAYSDEARVCAAYLLSRYGAASDTAALLAIASSGYGELKRPAAEAALALAPGLDGAAGKFLASQSHELVVMALKHLGESPLVDSDRDAAIGLLHSSVLAIRNAAVAFLIQFLSNQELEDLLERYTSEYPYYYSVVCQLDKVIYAPTCLRNSLKIDITKALDLR